MPKKLILVCSNGAIFTTFMKVINNTFSLLLIIFKINSDFVRDTLLRSVLLSLCLYIVHENK